MGIVKSISVSRRNQQTFDEVMELVGDGGFTGAVFYALRRALDDGSIRRDLVESR